MHKQNINKKIHNKTPVQSLFKKEGNLKSQKSNLESAEHKSLNIKILKMQLKIQMWGTWIERTLIKETENNEYL